MMTKYIVATMLALLMGCTPDAPKERTTKFEEGDVVCSVLTGERLQIVELGRRIMRARMSSAGDAAMFGAPGNSKFLMRWFEPYELEECKVAGFFPQ